MFLRMFFDSIKAVNRLRKEINMLLSKGIKILTLKLLLRKTDILELRFSMFKKFISFGELQYH